MSQLAAILVTDVVASTELRRRLGEERADEVRRVHDRVLGDAARAAGGEVVKGLGDGILARFSGAADAVAAAVAMQQALDATSGDDERVQIRIGVALGDVTIEDGDVFGTPVVEASRLCADAEGGQILVADLVRVLTHGRGEHEFVSLGVRELKGLGAPFEVCEVVWTPCVSTADVPCVPLPAPLASGDRFAYAGRAAALELLAMRWKQACTEERQIVLLAGEPGIGKTRLAAELARDVVDEGAIVILGRCFDDVAAAYAPFTEAFGHLVRHLPEELLTAHVEHAGADLVRIVPDLERLVALPPLTRGDAELERLRLFDAAVDLLARVGELSPVLLVLDDLHWADASTVELLQSLARAARPMRLTVVGTYRDTDVARSHPFGAALAELRRTRGTERIALTGLDESEVETFLERAGGHALDEAAVAFAAQLHAETEGNPFFLQELLVHFAESGALVREGDRWVASGDISELGVPEGVRDVVGRRLSMLSDDVNDVLRAASVVGTEFGLETLDALVQLGDDALLDALEEPTRRGLLVESGIDRYRFAHALIRQTLYEELAAGRRARLHRRAADALELAGAPVAEVAHHLIEAGPRGDPERAVRLARAAAAAAEGQLAWEQAVRWYRRGLDQAELIDLPDQDRAAILLGVGRAMNAAGDMAGARGPLVEAANLADQAGDAALLAAAAIEYGGSAGPWLEYGDTTGLELLRRAELLLPDDELASRATVASYMAWWHIFDPDPAERGRLAARAVALARQSGDAKALVDALGSHLQEGLDVDIRSRVELAGEMLETARGTDASRLALALDVKAQVLLRAGAVLDGTASLLEYHRFQAQIGHTGLARHALVALNAIEILAGRLDNARRHLEPVVGSAVSAGEAISIFGQQLLLADMADDVDTLERLWDEAAADHNPIVFIFPWRAQIASLRGQPEDAAALIDEWRRSALPACPAFIRAYAEVYTATILRRARNAELGAWLYEELAERSGEWTLGAVPFGAFDTWLGVLASVAGRPDDARRHLTAAWDSHVTEGALLWLPVIEMELAQLAIDEDDGDEAQRRIDAAMEVATEVGSARFLREARELAASRTPA